MYIKCWGSRGSIPVAGEEYNKYGGDTTCIQIRAQSGETVIIDAGTGLRKLGLDLPSNINSNYHMLFTHTHWDHISGFPFFKPLQDSNVTLTIHNSRFYELSVKEIIANIMALPFFPITMKEMQANVIYQESDQPTFTIGSLDIETIPLSHPGGGLGYRFSENGRVFVFLTDNELTHPHPGGMAIKDYTLFCKDADFVFHDMEFTPEEYPSKKGWGHSSCTDVIELAINANVKQLGLFHINQERTDDAMDQMVDLCQDIIRKKNSPMTCFGVAGGMEFTLL
ncbi:MAG: MBL fold metallo-hydrolase [Desulfamplus sp.]|nr:MBL fold metallo-hydrolase [Desulfamplus sp.]MBF0413391.1 MBL fold metallo-hydrolase [Desulfamplus sp.]